MIESQAGELDIKKSIERFDTGLDEVTRARIEAKLLARLDEKPRASWRRLAPFAVAAAAAAIALWFARPIDQPRAILSPSLIAGFEPAPELAGAMLGPLVERLDAPAGGIVRAELGEDALVTLIGPGALTVKERTNKRVVIVLDSGLLIADVKPDRKRAFIVEAPQVTVEVIGTLFAVDARDRARPSVAVARGVVEVRPPGLRLAAGERWPADASAGDRELREHGSSPRAVNGGVLIVRSDLRGGAARLENGTVLGPLPLRAKLEPGRQVLIISGEGREAQTIEAEVVKGSVATVQVVWPKLEPPPVVGPPQVPPAPPPRARAPAPVPLVRVEKPIDAETMYRRAEEALEQGDRAAASAQLRELVARFPNDPLAETALYDLARIAGDREQARAYLEELLARGGDPALAEPAQHMLCKLHVEAGRDREAIECLAAFHRRYPSSAHARSVLRSLAALAERTAGCRAALPWIEELARSHPDDPLAQEVEERRKRCSERN